VERPARGHAETIGERLARDRDAFLSLPQAPYDACEKRAARVNSLSLVRYRGMTNRRPPMDTVKYLVLCLIECRPPRLDLMVYPFLPQAKVAPTAAKST